MGSQTTEDYLKAIYDLQTDGMRAKTSQLADRLAVTAGTVTEMLKRLAASDPPLLTYKQHHGVRLTDHGERMALNVIRRHRLLETFLHQTLGLTWDQVHAEAELLEHSLSARVTDALDRFLKFPQSDPHGEPIPDAVGQLPPYSMVTLADIAEGQQFRVVRIQPVRSDLLQYLHSEKIHIGTKGTLIARAPFEGPLTLQLHLPGKERESVLGHKVSRHIYVELIPG